jgi:hypothetical protein
MRLPFFDRLDFLMTKALLAIVGVGVPVISIGWPLVSWLRDEPLRWTLDGLGVTTVPDRLVPLGGVSLRGADTITVRIEDAGAGAWMATLLPGLLLSVAVGLVAWLLLRVVQRIERSEPFVSASAVALRLVGATILLGSLAVSLGLGAADVVITGRALEGADPDFGFEVNFIAFVAALLMLALAEAFAQGARLQKDVEGLV